MELDVGEHRRVAIEVERVLADEVALEVGEAVHRVAGADADVTGIVVDLHDRRRELGARPRVPRRGERWIERELVVADVDAGDGAHDWPLADPLRSSVHTREGARREVTPVGVVGDPAVVVVHREVLLGDHRRGELVGFQLELGKATGRAGHPDRSEELAEQVGELGDRTAERNRRGRVRARRAIDVPFECRGQPDRHRHTVRDVGERAEGVADRMRDSGSATVDREAGEQCRLLHGLPGIERRRARRTAVGRCSTTSRRAWSAGADTRAVVRRPLTASRAWTNASRPVAAVTWAGIVTVDTGSSTTRSGSSSSPHVHTLRPSRSVTMHVRVTSAPVPAVVGMAIIGRWPGSGLAASA